MEGTEGAGREGKREGKKERKREKKKKEKSMYGGLGVGGVITGRQVTLPKFKPW